MSNFQSYPGGLFTQEVTIANGASVSEMIATNGMALLGIRTPSNGWTAAAIGYKACFSGNPNLLVTVYDNGGNFEQTLVSTDAAAASVEIAIPQSDTLFRPFIQLTSRTAGTDSAVAQGAARVLTLVFRKYLS